MSEYLYRICWSEANGHSGHGEYCLTEAAANDWLSHLRSSHPTMRHWSEKQ